MRDIGKRLEQKRKKHSYLQYDSFMAIEGGTKELRDMVLSRLEASVGRVFPYLVRAHI